MKSGLTLFGLLGTAALLTGAAPPKAPAPNAFTNERPIPAPLAGTTHSVARQWNELLLEAIRNDFARPTVHARNLFHISAAMWDAWAAYDPTADGWINNEQLTATDIEAARNEAISFASYRLLLHRFQNSPGFATVAPLFAGLMDTLGYDKTYTGTVGDDPASFGNRLAAQIILFGQSDGSNEASDYANQYYEPSNDPLIPPLPGNPDMTLPNRWQPLSLDFFIDQSGNPIPFGYPEFLSPEWGLVTPFALTPDQLDINQRDGEDWWTWLDPGPPPLLGDTVSQLGDDDYKLGHAMVAVWSSQLDPVGNPMVDISPGAIGNATLTAPEDWLTFYEFTTGGDNGTGYAVNPSTGLPYAPQIVPLGDYTRILAEFWADGPDSETPPGHWFDIANYVADHPMLVKQLGGAGALLDDLEWDVKIYFALGGAMHDAAVSTWSVKGWYDYARPISAIRYMADRGQSSDPTGPSYHPEGLPLVTNYIEVVTAATVQPGERHEHLAVDGDGLSNIGKIAVYAWRGPDYIGDPATDTAGVGWILAENWWPYQRPSFVSPPFAGYVSGHSCYSRTAALMLSLLTGDEYFPGGLGEFSCPQNDFLVFEEGPSANITLQWARYMDASDQCSLSRIWGGIHPPADDLPGRMMGDIIGPQSYDHAVQYFRGLAVCPGDNDGDGEIGFDDLLATIANWGPCDDCPQDLNLDGQVDFNDLLSVIANWGPCP